MVQGGPNQSEVVQGGPNRFEVVQGGPNRSEVIQGGPNRSEVVYGGPSRASQAWCRSPPPPYVRCVGDDEYVQPFPSGWDGTLLRKSPAKVCGYFYTTKKDIPV